MPDDISLRSSLPFGDVDRNASAVNIKERREGNDYLHKSLLTKATFHNVKHAFAIPKTVKIVLAPGADHSAGLQFQDKDQHETEVHEIPGDELNTNQRSSDSGALYVHEFDEDASFSSSLPGSLPPGIHASRPRTAPSE